MATNTSVNSPLSGTTGTGNFVGSTSPTLTTPKIGQIDDPAQNLAAATFSNPPNSVNYFNFTGQSTGLPPVINVIGTDTNIGMNLQAKGIGGFQLLSQALTTPLTIYNGTSGQHSTDFIFSNTAASRQVTFPDLSGTLALSGASQNVTFGTVGTSQINDTNGNASLKFNPIPSAVNYLQIDNDAAGGDGPLISCVGSSATMNLRLAPKNGAVQIQTTNTGGTALRIDTGSPTYQHVTFLQFPLTSAIRTVAFPDLSGTVALSGASMNVDFGIMQCSSIYAPNGTGLINPNGVTNAVNYWTISNNSTGQPVYMASGGSDANISQYFVPKGDASVVLFTTAITAPPLAIQSGTSGQHVTNFYFSNTAVSRAVTFPDATGTVALSGASQNVQFGQVGANGPNISTYALTAHGGTNQNLAISGATLIANAVTLAAVNDANSANVPLEIRASGIYASTGMVDSTAGNMVKWNPTGGQFTYDSLSYDVRAWVNFDGTGTVAIRASSNVSSITDNGTGDYTVNYATALSSANYSFVGTGSYLSGNYRGAVIISMSGTSTATLYSTTQTRFLTDNAQTDTRQDAGYICCATFL